MNTAPRSNPATENRKLLLYYYKSVSAGVPKSRFAPKNNATPVRLHFPKRYACLRPSSTGNYRLGPTGYQLRGADSQVTATLVTRAHQSPISSFCGLVEQIEHNHKAIIVALQFSNDAKSVGGRQKDTTALKHLRNWIF